MAMNVFELNINLMQLDKSEAKEALKNTTEAAATQQNSNSDGKETKTLKDAAPWAGKQVVQVVKQMAVYELNKTGALYGDTARQNQIDNMMTTASMGMGIVSMAQTGMSVGGPWGAVIGAVIGTVGEVIQGAQRAQEYKIEQQNNKREADYAQERLGILASCKGR